MALALSARGLRPLLRSVKLPNAREVTVVTNLIARDLL